MITDLRERSFNLGLMNRCVAIYSTSELNELQSVLSLQWYTIFSWIWCIRMSTCVSLKSS